jgi:hypothetical protein
VDSEIAQVFFPFAELHQEPIHPSFARPIELASINSDGRGVVVDPVVGGLAAAAVLRVRGAVDGGHGGDVRALRHGAGAGLPLHALVRRPEGRRLPLPPRAAARRPLRDQEQGQRLRHRRGVRAVPRPGRQGLRRLLPPQQHPRADPVLRL